MSQKFNLINELPIKILQEIFRRVPQREVLKLRLVCLLWNALIQNFSYSRNLLNLQICKSNVQPNNLNFLQETTTKFHQLSLVKSVKQDLPPMAWQKVGPHLKILTFRHCVETSLTAFDEILNYCENLQHLQIHDHFPPLGPGYRIENYRKFNWKVQKIKRFEMFCAKKVDSAKLGDFVNRMPDLEYLRVESESLETMKDVNLNDTDKGRGSSLKTLYLVDNSGRNTTEELLRRMVQHSSLHSISTFGCRLLRNLMTDTLRNFLMTFKNLRVFEMWIHNSEIRADVLFDMFKFAENLVTVTFHYDRYQMKFTRSEVQTFKQNKLKKIVFY